jgi:hypothetical protein
VIGVIALVGEQGSGLDKSSQRPGLRDVMGIPTGEAQRQRISKSIDDDMDFCCQSATRAAYGLVEAPFLRAPALC